MGVEFRSFARAYLRPQYLSLGILSFLAFYVALKFLFLVFNATDVMERWVFELTPLHLYSFADIQLALLSAMLAGLNALIHFSGFLRQRILRISLTLLMVASLILALRTSPYYFDTVNVGRFAVLAALLLTVPLDHLTAARARMPWRGDALPSQTELWPAAPQQFDEVMTSVDEALGLLDTSAGAEEADEELSELATDLLEDLMTTIGETGEERDASLNPDRTEVERRRILFEQRLRAIDTRLDKNAKDVDALFAKATYLAMRGEHEDAIRSLDEVTRLSPYYPGVWHLKAKVYEMMGETAKAEQARRRARSVP